MSTKFFVIKDLHADIGGHRAGSEIELRPGMARALLQANLVCAVGGPTHKALLEQRKLETKPALQRVGIENKERA